MISRNNETKALDQNPAFIRKALNMVVEKTVHELRGESYLPLGESPEPEQMIACNRFVSEQVIDLESQREAVTCYTSCAAEQLRAQGDYCRML